MKSSMNRLINEMFRIGEKFRHLLLRNVWPVGLWG